MCLVEEGAPGRIFQLSRHKLQGKFISFLLSLIAFCVLCEQPTPEPVGLQPSECASWCRTQVLYNLCLEWLIQSCFSSTKILLLNVNYLNWGKAWFLLFWSAQALALRLSVHCLHTRSSTTLHLPLIFFAAVKKWSSPDSAVFWIVLFLPRLTVGYPCDAV